MLVVAAGLALLLALPLFAPPGAAATTLRDGPAPQPHPDDLDPEETAPVPGASTRSGGPLASAAVSGTEKAALQKLLAASPNDLWAVSDAVAASIMPTWDSKTGSYRTGTVIRARANAEMLLVHSQAILAGHHGTANQPKRIAPLVELLTGPAWQEHAHTAHNANCPRGGAECWHAMGFVDAPVRHQPARTFRNPEPHHKHD